MISQFTLGHFVKQTWRQRYTIFGITCTFGFLAIAIIALAQPQYDASMLIAPTPSSMNLEPQQLDVRSLVTGRGSSNFSPIDVYTSLVTSRAVADVLASDPNFMHQMFAAYWNAQIGQWEAPSGLIERLKNVVRPLLGRPKWHPPDGGNVADFLVAHLSIESYSSSLFGASSVQRLSIMLDDPAFAKELLNRVHHTADRLIRDRNFSGVESEIAILNAELTNPQTAYTREALIRVLADLVQRRALMKSQEDYAVIVIDPPNSSSAPVYPKPILILGSFLILSAIFSVAAILLLWSRPALRISLSSLWVRRRRVFGLAPAPDWAVATERSDV
jgi:hypothetical protein